MLQSWVSESKSINHGKILEDCAHLVKRPTDYCLRTERLQAPRWRNNPFLVTRQVIRLHGLRQGACLHLSPCQRPRARTRRSRRTVTLAHGSTPATSTASAPACMPCYKPVRPVWGVSL